MNIKSFLSVFLFGASLASLSNAEQDLPSVDELTDGLHSFMCDFENEVGTSVPVIFIQNEKGWQMSGTYWDDVAKIDNGFRIKKSQSENDLGYLLREGGSWYLYFLGETGQDSHECAPMDLFTTELVSAIAPKLLRNVNKTLTSPEEDALISQIEKLKQKNQRLIKNSRMWQDRIADLEQQLQEK